MASLPTPRITEEEYLRLERAAEYKSEFVDGELFAMSGGSLPHSILAANWIAMFPLIVEIQRAINLPTTSSPIQIVVIEVLSPSTADYDKGRKFELFARSRRCHYGFVVTGYTSWPFFST